MPDLPPVFLVNLDSRPERLEIAAERLRGQRVEFERFSALSGPQAKTNGLGCSNRSLLEGDVGCIGSHLAIYELMLKRGLETAIILEDDVLPVLRFHARAATIMRQLPADFLICQLGFCDLAPLRAQPLRRLVKSAAGNITTRYDGIYNRPFKLGTHAYVVSSAFAELALAYCNPAFAPIDIMLEALTSEPTAARGSWVCDPTLALQDASPSSIRSYRPREGYGRLRRFLA